MKMDCGHIDLLPNELLEQVLQYLPVYDQIISLGSTNKRLRALAARYQARQHAINNTNSLIRGSPVKRVLGLRSNPTVEIVSRDLVCALDYKSLVTWETSSTPTNEYDDNDLSTHQSASFDTCILGSHSSQQLIVWQNSGFTIFRSSGGSNKIECSRRYKRLIGNKNFVVSPSGRFVGCLVNNFGHRYAEVYDTSDPSEQATFRWHSGLQSLDFSFDERIWAFVTACCQAVLKTPWDEIELEPHDGASAVSVKFCPDNSLLAVSKSNGTISIFNLAGSEISTLGTPRTGTTVTLKLDFFEGFLVHHSETVVGTDSTQELCVWNVGFSDDAIFSYCINTRQVSRFEYLGFSRAVSGILVLLDGGLKCWVFSPEDALRSQRVIEMTAVLQGRITSAKLGPAQDCFVAVGCEDGSVMLFPPPSPIDILERGGVCWKVGIVKSQPSIAEFW